MFGGRTVAMAANRLIDAEIDARNPRTAGRAIPMGTLKRGEMVFFIAVALALFLLAVYNLSDWAQRLWPAALAPLIFYPYLKRFTWLCHFGLSTVYLIVPPAVWLAVAGDLPVGAMLLGLGAGMWVAGFDVIYALQDIAFDRANRVHSIPARFGVATALRDRQGPAPVDRCLRRRGRRGAQRGPPLLRRRGGLLPPPRRRAQPGIAERHLAGRRGLLQYERHHQRSLLHLRHGGRVGAVMSVYVVGVTGASGAPYAVRVLAGPAGGRPPRQARRVAGRRGASSP